MRIFSYVNTFLFSLLLAACGGGGGSPGLSSGSVSTFSVAAPAAVTLQVGLLQPYAVKGGVKPYTVLSNDPAIAVGWIGGDDVLYVGTVLPGKATITTVDAKGSKFDIAVTAGASTVFYTTAPTVLTVAPGTAGAQTFKVGGGVPPYSATSSDSSVAVATPGADGITFTITGQRVSAAAATITFRDSANATATSAVTVATVPLAINPTSVKAFIGDTIFARISGGTPPYRVDTGVIDPPAVTTTIANQNELTIVINRALTGYELIVIDANNQTTKLTLEGTVGTNVFRVSPATMTIAESESQTLTLNIYGASTTGTPKVFSSHIGLITAAISGNVVTLTRTGGCVNADTDVTITVVDGKGAIGTAVVTIKNTVTSGVCTPP